MFQKLLDKGCRRFIPCLCTGRKSWARRQFRQCSTYWDPYTVQECFLSLISEYHKVSFSGIQNLSISMYIGTLLDLMKHNLLKIIGLAWSKVLIENFQ